MWFIPQEIEVCRLRVRIERVRMRELRNLAALLRGDTQSLGARARAAGDSLVAEVERATAAVEKMETFQAEVKAARAEVEGALAEITNFPPPDAPPGKQPHAAGSSLGRPDSNGVRLHIGSEDAHPAVPQKE